MTDWADDIAATLRNQEHAAQALRDLAAEKDKEIEFLRNVVLKATEDLEEHDTRGAYAILKHAIRNQTDD